MNATEFKRYLNLQEQLELLRQMTADFMFEESVSQVNMLYYYMTVI